MHLTDTRREIAGLAAAAGVLPAAPLHLAIGMFDGVHRGHQAVVGAAVAAARGTGGASAALTFHPHPSRLLRPDQPVQLILPPAVRARQLLAGGVDAVILEPFTRELAAIEAEEFLPYLRAHLPQLAAVFVGENWRFGRARRGDVALLIEQGRRLGLAVSSAPRIASGGEPISSTRIRACLEGGEIGRANELLGYAYASEGAVQPGKRLGRTIGFPTLNLAWTPECRPRLGVYAVRVRGAADPTRDGGRAAVANYGVRPTVEQRAPEPVLEVHVLGECPWREGDAVRVEWLHFLRAETRFPDLDALRAQIGRDVVAARAFHDASPR